MTIRFRLRLLLRLGLMAVASVLSASPSITVAGPVRGGHAPGASVAVTTTWVRLVLQLPQTSYPPDALVPATVNVTNLTSRPISTWDCLADSLGAQVVGSQGIEAYPPLLRPPGAPWSNCPGVLGPNPVRHQVQIAPGATLSRTLDIVLRARNVRAWVDLDLASGQGKPAVIFTPVLRVGSATTPSPHVVLQTYPTLQARVVPVPGAGPILYSEFAQCPGTPTVPERVVTTAPYSRWSVATSDPLVPFSSPPCAAPVEWYLFVGQTGLPVQEIYYCRQHSLCNYAPPSPRESALGACKVDIARAIGSGQLPRSAARYAIGLASSPPGGLNAAQLKVAKAFHQRCAPVLRAPQP